MPGVYSTISQTINCERRQATRRACKRLLEKCSTSRCRYTRGGKRERNRDGEKREGFGRSVTTCSHFLLSDHAKKLSAVNLISTLLLPRASSASSTIPRALGPLIVPDRSWCTFSNSRSLRVGRLDVVDMSPRQFHAKFARNRETSDGAMCEADVLSVVRRDINTRFVVHRIVGNS